jgi:hypothetical protein
VDTGLLALIQTIGAVLIAAIVAVVVGRRRGIDANDHRTDDEIKRLVDAQSARLLLLEAENARQAVQMSDQRDTITRLTAEQASLRSKIEQLETDLARERRVTAGMRGETTA